MNIFATEQGILGDTDYARQHNTFHAFLTLARSIRKRLGARAYKLDEYIRQLLIACSIIYWCNALSHVRTASQHRCRKPKELYLHTH